jgi:hypothetical protein
MAMNDRHMSPIDESMREAVLLFGNLISPIGSPMDLCDDHITWLFYTCDLIGNPPNSIFAEVWQEVHSGNLMCCRPIERDAARYRSEGASLALYLQDGGCTCLDEVAASSGTFDPQP